MINSSNKFERSVDWFYVYYYNNGDWIYERTCGTQKCAEEKCDELRKIYEQAQWLKNETLKDSFY